MWNPTHRMQLSVYTQDVKMIQNISAWTINIQQHVPLLFKCARGIIIIYVSNWHLRFISVLPRNFSLRFANFLSFFQAGQGDRWHRCRRFYFILTVQLECHQVTLRINRWRVRRCAEFKEIATKMLTEKSSSIIITSNCIYLSIYLMTQQIDYINELYF